MKKFTFDKKEQKLLTVEIEGKRFTFNPNTLAAKKASEKFVKCQAPIIKRLEKEGLSQKELNDIVIQSCSLVKETVNSILGKNAYNRIFEGRTVDFDEHQKLITFLFEEITNFVSKNPNETRYEFAN